MDQVAGAGSGAATWQLPSAPPPIRVRKRRKLVLRNKAPMWNENSQVNGTRNHERGWAEFNMCCTSIAQIQIILLGCVRVFC